MTEATTTTDVKDVAATTTTTTADSAATTAAATTSADKTAASTTAATTDKAATIIGDKTAATDDATKSTVPATWPADWRDRMVADVKPGDTKLRERLERFASPIDITRSFLAIEQKLSSGEKPAAGPPKDATPEQLATYRKDNGIPEKPEYYSLELPGGIKFDEDDKPLLDKFLKAAHGKNMSQAQVTDSLLNFHSMQKEQADQLAAFDNDHKLKGEDALRAEFGTDYRRNVAVADNYVSTMPEDLAADFINGRLANGLRIGADPRMIKWLVSQGMEYPSLTPAGGEGKGGDNRLEEIRKFARENPDKYDQDKAMQQEQRTLLERKSTGRRAA